MEMPNRLRAARAKRSGHQIARHAEGANPMSVKHLEVRSLFVTATT
jgi:hypothetical protein